MTDQQLMEKIKKVEEYGDIKRDLERTQNLLYSQNWNELSFHLQNLTSKYFREKVVYNSFNPSPPCSLQENAQNCIKFLNELLISKRIEIVEIPRNEGSL